MKKLNKNGFTLVELLAVIVVLAVIMLLAVNAVIPQMNKARKNAFATEAQTFIDAAATYYQTVLLTGIPTGDSSTLNDGTGTTGACINVKDLIGDYVDKGDKDATSGEYLYNGVVKISITNDVASYEISLANGNYYTTADGKDGSAAALIAAGELDESTVSAGPTAAKTACN